MEATETPQVEQLTAEALQKVLQWVESAEGFVVEQAPLVAQEIVTWGFASSIAMIVVGAMLLPVAIVAGRKAGPEWTRSNGNPVIGVGGALVAMVGGVLGPLMLCDGCITLIYIYFAPRLYVIEQLSNLAK